MKLNMIAILSVILIVAFLLPVSVSAETVGNLQKEESGIIVSYDYSQKLYTSVVDIRNELDTPVMSIGKKIQTEHYNENKIKYVLLFLLFVAAGVVCVVFLLWFFEMGGKNG